MPLELLSTCGIAKSANARPTAYKGFVAPGTNGMGCLDIFFVSNADRVTCPRNYVKQKSIAMLYFSPGVPAILLGSPDDALFD
jgi:hypothetical protein